MSQSTTITGGHQAHVSEAHGHGDELRRELLRLLFSQTPVVLAANLVNGSLIAGLFYREFSMALIVGWWMLLVLMVAVRAALWSLYRRHSGAHQRWARVAIAGSAISGLLWGSAGLLFYSADNETHRMVLGFILAGMGGGAVASLTPCMPAFYLYLFPTAIPFIARLAMQGDVDHLVTTAACLLYVGSLALLGWRANQWLRESVVRRLDNAHLIRSLEGRVAERTLQLEEVNRILRADIAERRRAESALADYGKRQAAIAEFGRTALSGIDLDAVYQQAVALVRDRLAIAGAVILEKPLDGTGPVLCKASSLEADQEASPPSRGFAETPQRAMRPTPTLPLPGERDDSLGCPPPDSAKRTEVLISNQGGRLRLLLAIKTDAGAFSADDRSFMQSIANMVAAAIERKRAERNIERLALQDLLTGLPNRALFRSHLHQELARTRRAREKLAILLLDLDHFKDVNDTLGHPAGDGLLRAVADRLRACLREEDAPARLGGDEFAVILSNLRSPEEAAAVARKILKRLSDPFFLEGHQLHIGVSIGITISPDDAADVDRLLRNADLALYRAKTEGRNGHRFYAADMMAQVEDRKALERDLRRALERDELFLVYQPQFDLKTLRPIGAEALLRWQHPTRGLLLPGDFIPIAEATGLIVPLGQWVLRRVARQRREWLDAGLAPVFIATNVSVSQCRRGDLIRVIEEIGASMPDLSWLEIEVTEHVFLPPGAEDLVETLRRLSALGITVSIDDFGAGYSSLGRLRNLAVDKVKIDRAFVAELGVTASAENIVRAIIALARSLDMTVTAEGVETEQQLAFLAAAGCDCVQGYHLGMPLPPAEFAARLSQPAGEATGGAAGMGTREHAV